VEVRIKKLDINMFVKQRGIEFEVRTPNGLSQVGDCYLTMTGLVWCKGKTTKPKGDQDQLGRPSRDPGTQAPRGTPP